MAHCDCKHDIDSLGQQRPSSQQQQEQQYPPLAVEITQPSSTMSSEPKQPPRRPAPFRAGSVGIRRLASATDSASIRLSTPTQAGPLDRIRSNTDGYASATTGNSTEQNTGRRRSFSAPQSVDYEYVGRNTPERQQNRPESGFSQQSRPLSGGTYLQDIAEGEEGRTPGRAGASVGTPVAELPGSVPGQQDEGHQRRRQESVASSTDTHSVTKRLRSATTGGGFFSRRKTEQPTKLERGRSEIGMRKAARPESKDYESSVVDVLDVMDPYVSTLTTLNNVQNSLFIPDLGRFLNRRPTYELYGRSSQRAQEQEEAQEVLNVLNSPELRPRTREEDQNSLVHQPTFQRTTSRATINTLNTITSQLSESRYAVLPHGMTLHDWSQEDKDLLNDHVRHLLHSRREKLKRQWRAFRNYVKKPLGLFVTVYAFLVTTFGLVWVLFLIGWIGGGYQHEYFINVIDNVLVALFALIGDVLAPFRAVDTYHMIYIVHYHRLTWKIRQKEQLPNLADPNDLPSKDRTDIDLEAAFKHDQEAPVLTPAQQAKLEHHQQKFAKSHTFYRPHETETHHAFPIRILCLVVVLLDFHSIFQIALGSVTWGWSYHTRPQWITAVILALSLTCNISGGIWISIGDKRSRKKEVLERMFRQKLTTEALEKVERARKTAEERSARPYSGT